MKFSELPLRAVVSYLVILAVTLPAVSIAVSQIFLSFALLAFILDSSTGQRWKRLRFPPIKAPLFAFMLATLFSLISSPEPEIGLAPIYKFWLFMIVLLVFNYLSVDRIVTAFYGLFSVGVVAAAFALFQRIYLSPGTVEERLTGFMGHWMTLSGELMLILVAMAAYPLFNKPRWKLIWPFALAVVVVGLALTLTRSVWLASLAALCMALWMRYLHWQALLAGAVSVVLLLLVSPDFVHRRLRSVVDPNDPSNYARLAIWSAGVEMIQENPWFGVGPQRVSRVFYDYHPYPEDRERSGFYPVHMHNNLLQFAAERGIPCAAAWMWLMVAMAIHHWRRFHRSQHPSPEKAIAAVGLLSILALFLSGLFEFNFGDSEVLMIFLFLVSAPYVAASSTAEDSRVSI